MGDSLEKNGKGGLQGGAGLYRTVVLSEGSGVRAKTLDMKKLGIHGIDTDNAYLFACADRTLVADGPSEASACVHLAFDTG